ncbi:NAD(P)-binding protein [Cylindrobasidium torrendii FP15055 ss-10]|uniref:NAD(P)-binding protein n=1 Tax=Cylindrobasidium torrendii FP15055 ss-10 TaxID=1314674 RepID=A0A0D7AYM7_9AGAR|nr:NAD(P)-binding protein [Cylindrobasidium torrendii FP15055 ss-10]
MTTKIFLTGATGYIGGSVLAELLQHPAARSFEITVLVRAVEKAELLKELGLRTIIGSNSDHALLKEAASEADITIACADADDLGAAQAILAGAKEYRARTGKNASLIHTSGTGVLSVKADGEFVESPIYSDLDIPLIEKLSLEQPHREVDVALVKDDADGNVNTYIVLPSTIYGRATGILVDKGIQKTFSDQVPTIVRAGLARGQGGRIGSGSNLWPNVEVHEVAKLYLTIFDLIVSPPSTIPKEFEHGRGGFYFGENGEYTLIDVYKTVAGALHDLGIGSPEPTPFTTKDLEPYTPSGPNSISFSKMSRCKAERGRAIGWNPTKTVKDFLASAVEEVELFSQDTK